MTESPLRDLARKIYELAKDHPAYSQATVPVQACVDHINCIANGEEQRKKLISYEYNR